MIAAVLKARQRKKRPERKKERNVIEMEKVFFTVNNRFMDFSYFVATAYFVYVSHRLIAKAEYLDLLL